MNHLRYAFRTLLKTPGFFLLAVITLALGIGANTAIFSAVNGVLLRALPFAEPGRIVRIWPTTADGQASAHSAGDFLDLERENRSLAAIAGHRQGMISAASIGEPLQLATSFVTLDFFDVFGTAAARGRTFSRSRDRVGGERVVVLSDEAARQLFVEPAAAVGRRVRVNGQPHIVLGVMPPRFEWPRGTRVWILSAGEVPPPPIEGADSPARRDVGYFDAVARLRPGVNFEQARQDLNAIAVRSGREQRGDEHGVALEPVRETIVGDVRGALVLLQAAVGVVLLIACANISSLLIARATGRRRELAIRSALGAGRGHLIRQLLAESLVLGACGGLVGLLLGAWLTAALVRLLPAGVPRVDDIGLDVTVTLVTLASALAAGVLFGILPALQASRVDTATAIKEAGDRASARLRGRLALAVAEMAMTLVLLVSAGLLANSFIRLQRTDSGMRVDQVTIAAVNLPPTRYPSRASQVQLYERFLEALRRHPDLRAAGIGFPAPLRGDNASGHFYIEGRPPSIERDQPFTYISMVSAGFLPALGVPLVSGRLFTDADRADATRVALVSASLARRYWPGRDPIGRRVRLDDDPQTPWMTIVGVVADARQLGLDRDPPPLLYVPYQQFPLPFTTIAVRSALEQGAVASLLRSELASIDRDLPLSRILPLQRMVDRSVEQPRFRTMVIGLFALVALVLAAVGVYGVISYSVTQRSREIGIRVALGAPPRHVLFSMLREGIMMAFAGIAIGLAGSLAATRLLARFLFGVGTTDLLTFSVVASTLFGVALLASYLPARRALRVDPLMALRAE